MKNKKFHSSKIQWQNLRKSQNHLKCKNRGKTEIYELLYCNTLQNNIF